MNYFKKYILYVIYMTSTRLIIIDTRVSDYPKIINGIKIDTISYVLLDYYTDTFETLLNKISELPLVNPLESVALVSHGANVPVYKMIESMSPAQLYDVSSVDANLDSWSEFRNFFKCLCVSTIDLLGCAIYMNDNWKYVLNTLETQMEVNFRASVDDTGNLVVGGNWVLESDNVNIKDLYFNEGIEEWMGLLQTDYVSAGTCIIDIFGNLYRCINNVFNKINTVTKVVHVSTGKGSIAFTDISYNLYVFGYDINGSLGRGNFNNTFIDTPILININNQKILSAACGSDATFCIDISGKLYATGLNTNGQLGLNDTTNRNIFTLVSSISNESVTQVSVNNYRTACVTSSGKLFVWGNNNGQSLGISGDTTNKLIPTRIVSSSTGTNDISNNEKVIQVSVGSDGYGFITSTGNVYLIDPSGSVNKAPILCNDISNAVNIRCGNKRNVYVLTKDGNMYYRGVNLDNYAGSEITTFQLADAPNISNFGTNPLKIKRIVPYSIYYNASNTIEYWTGFHILDYSGNLYGYGYVQPYGNGSTLGIGTENTRIPLTKVTIPQSTILSLNDDIPFDYTYKENFNINSIDGKISWDNNLMSGDYEVTVDASSSIGITSTVFTIRLTFNKTSPTNFIYDTNGKTTINYGKPLSISLLSTYNTGNNTDLIYTITPSHPTISISQILGTISINPIGTNYLPVNNNIPYQLTASVYSLSRPDLSASTQLSLTVFKTDPVLKYSGYDGIYTYYFYNPVGGILYGTSLGDMDFSLMTILNGNETKVNRPCFNPYNYSLDTSYDISGTFSFYTPSVVPSVADSNNTLYRYKFTPDDLNNYNEISDNRVVLVQKAIYTVDIVSTDISFGQKVGNSNIILTIKNFTNNQIVQGNFIVDNSSTIPPNVTDSYNIIYSFYPNDTTNYSNIVNIYSYSLKVTKSDPSNISFNIIDLSYGQQLGNINQFTGVFRNKFAGTNLPTITGKLTLDNSGNIPNTFDSSTQPWTFTPDASNNYNTIKGNINIRVTKTDPELSGTIVDTDISFGDNITSSIITAVYRNPYTKVIIPGTRTWDLSGIPSASFGANKDFSANTGSAPWTTATFRPSNLTDISNHNNASLGKLSVYIRATAPKNMSYSPNPTNASIATVGSSNAPLFGDLLATNSYDTGGLPLTYKIREIKKVA